MGRISGIAKAIAKITAQSTSRQAGRAGKVAGKFSRAMSRAGGTLTKLATAAAVGAAAGAKAGAVAAKEGLAQTGKGIMAVGKAAQNSTNTNDPIINLPALADWSSIAAAMFDLGSMPSHVDIKTTSDTKFASQADFDSFVEGMENYFDDQPSRPIVIESVIPAGTEIEAVSKSLGSLEEKITEVQGSTLALQSRMDRVYKKLGFAIEQNKRIAAANERRRDEEDVEKKDSVVPSQAGRIAENVGTMTAGVLSKYVIPALALLGWGMADALADSAEGDDETLAEKLAFLDGIEETYLQMYAAFRGASGSLSSGFSKISAAFAEGKLKTISNLSTKFTVVANQVSMARKNVAIFMTGLKVAGTSSPMGMRFAQTLQTFRSIISGFARGLKNITAPIMRIVNSLPSFVIKLLKGFASKAIKWTAIFLAVDTMIDAALAFGFGQISEEEFHKRTKDNINFILGIMSGIYVTTFICTLLGTVIGTYFPIFGNLVGAAVGFVVGIVIGDDLYKMIGMNVLVDAVYDWLVSGFENTSGFKSLVPKMIDAGKKALEEVIQKYKDFFKDMGRDEIASAEDIKADYGEDATLIEIAEQAKGGILSDDENAMLYVADNINSYQELEAFNEEFKQRNGVTLQDHARSFMNDDEFAQFIDTLDASVQEGGVPVEEKPSVAYNVTDYDNNIIGSFDTPEEAAQFAMTNQGIVQNALAVADTPELDYDEVAIAGVQALQTVLTGEKTDADKLKQMYGAAKQISEDGNYESVKKAYSDIVGRPLEKDMGEVFGEHATALDQIMSSSTLADAVEVVADETLASVLETAMPDVSSDIKNKVNEVIAITNQIAARGGRERGSVAGNQSKSQVDSATPSFHTTDHFVSGGFQT